MPFNEKTDILATYTTKREDGYNYKTYLKRQKKYLYMRVSNEYETRLESARMGDAFFHEVYFNVNIIDESFLNGDSWPYSYYYHIRTKKDFGNQDYIQVDLPNGLTFWIKESTEGRTITKEEVELFRKQCFEM